MTKFAARPNPKKKKMWSSWFDGWPIMSSEQKFVTLIDRILLRPMADKRKSRMLSLRVTDAQFDYLEEMAQRIKTTTGFKITRASIVLKLMEFGLPHLEKEFPKARNANDPANNTPFRNKSA